MSIKTDMEKELIPKNSNVASNKGLHKKRVKREKKVKDASENGIEKHRYTGKSSPFGDAKRFVKFYRAHISAFSGKEPVFDSIETDCMMAGHILDDLRNCGRIDDRVFLEAWVSDFLKNKLKARKILNSKYTTLREFRSTLKEFSGVYRAVPEPEPEPDTEKI